MSIQRRLLLGLLAGLMALYVAASVTLFLATRIFLQRQFDATLTAKARTLGSLLRLMPNGQVSLEPSETPEAWSGSSAVEFYQAWAEDGEVLLRSSAVGQNDLTRSPVANVPCFADAELPGGTAGRVVTFRLTPILDDEGEHDSKEAPAKSAAALSKTVVVAVAQDTSELNRFLWIFFWSSVLVTMFACAGTVVVVQIVVHRGLRPLRVVAAQRRGSTNNRSTFDFPLTVCRRSCCPSVCA